MLQPNPPATGVAVTATGAVTASGTTVTALLDDVTTGRLTFADKKIGLVANPLLAVPGQPVHGDQEREVFAAHIDDPLDLDEVVEPSTLRAYSRDSRLLVYAMRTTGARVTADPDRVGVVLGTLHAGRNEYLAIHNATHRVNPIWGPQSGYNAPAAQLSIHLGARGPNLTLSTGATTGLDAVVAGASQLQAGVCDVVVAGGVDTLSSAITDPTGSPEIVRGPYEPGPGTLPQGEAAAVVVLQPVGADPDSERARLLGAGQATAAFPPDGAGSHSASALTTAAEEALRMALDRSGLAAQEVGFAVTASTGDRTVEAAELAALRAVFGPALPVCNVTGVTGRTDGADGAVVVVVAVEALAAGLNPPIVCRTGRSVSASGGPLAVCLAVDPGGNATTVVLSGTGVRKSS